MSCDKCSSERVAELFAHSKDSSNFICEADGIYSENTYFPEIPNICVGDDAQMDICLNCGKVQGEFPIQQPDTDLVYMDKVAKILDKHLDLLEDEGIGKGPIFNELEELHHMIKKLLPPVMEKEEFEEVLDDLSSNTRALVERLIV